MTATRTTGLVDVRLIGVPQVAEQAVTRLAELLDLDRRTGPYLSRKSPELVRFYLTGRLRPAAAGAPLAEIEDLKAARDLGGELAAISGHWAEMEAQPWWPPKAGDVAIGHPDPADPDPADPDPYPYGATFLAVTWPRSGDVRFRVVSSTAPDDPTPRGGYGIEDLWFEWPAVSIVRAGTIYPPRRRGVA
jgi:hypothetical protein